MRHTDADRGPWVSVVDVCVCGVYTRGWTHTTHMYACVRSMLVHEPLSSQYCSWSLDTGASAVVLTFHQFDVGAVVGGECASTEMRV